jgi:hypothetical protein
MLIPAISSSSNPFLNATVSSQSKVGQQPSSFQQIAQALQSGNVSSASQVFNALTQNASGTSGIQSAQLTQDLNALGSALQSGNLSAAQKAYSTFKQDLQNTNSATKMHHHHHHGREGTQAASTPSTSGIDVPSSVFSSTGLNSSTSPTSPGGSFLPFDLAA